MRPCFDADRNKVFPLLFAEKFVLIARFADADGCQFAAGSPDAFQVGAIKQFNGEFLPGFQHNAEGFFCTCDIAPPGAAVTAWARQQATSAGMRRWRRVCMGSSKLGWGFVADFTVMWRLWAAGLRRHEKGGVVPAFAVAGWLIR